MSRIISTLRGRIAFIAAGLAVATMTATSIAGVWVFRGSGPLPAGSFWESLLADRATLGFLRAAFVMLALYAIASAAALIVTGRWIRAVRSSGFEADDPRAIDAALSNLRAEFETAKQERDEAQRLLWRYLHG